MESEDAAEEPVEPEDAAVPAEESEDAVEEPVESEDAAEEPVEPADELADSETVVRPDRTRGTIDNGEDEIASGSDILVGTDTSNKWRSLGVVLSAIGLAALIAVAFIAIRRRTNY